MPSKALKMASGSYFLFLSLVVMTGLASAHRPLIVDSNQVCEGSCVNQMDRNQNMIGKIDEVGNGMDRLKGNAGSTISIIPIPIPGPNGGFQFHIGPIGYGGTWNFGVLPPGSFISYSQPIVVSPYSTPNSATPTYMSPTSATPTYMSPTSATPQYMPPSSATPSPFKPSAMPSPYSPPSFATPSPYTNVQPYQQKPGAFLPSPQYYFPSPFGQYPRGTNQMRGDASEHK